MKLQVICTLLATGAAMPYVSSKLEKNTLLLNGGVRVYEDARVPSYKLTASDPSSLGVDKVKQQSGYIQTPTGDKLFYWFFESRDNPQKDPVVLWLNGGPGCSSLEAVLFENGPATLNTDGSLTTNQWSWNKNANIIYLDQPANVGYSTGSQVTTTPQAAVDFAAFVKMWFNSFPQYKNNEFHIAGESYAGRYIPVFAEAIETDHTQPVKVKSVMIGNGLVNAESEYRSYQPFLCGQGGFNAVLSDDDCERMSRSVNRCTNELATCQQNGATGTSCDLANYYCSALETPWEGRNPYDVRDSTCAPSQNGLCYPVLDNLQQYLNQASVKSVLGADPNVNYQVCNQDMNAQFNGRHDGFAPTTQNITNLLQLNVPVLAYHGDKDIILNWLSGVDWTKNVAWSGQSQFQQAIANQKPWQPRGVSKQLGTSANTGPLSFLRVFDAGHMVPHDQPESAWYMFDTWVNKKDYAFTN